LGFAFVVWHRPASGGQDSQSALAPIVKDIEFQFPPALPGTVLTHAFVIKNDFNQPLHLDRLAVSCACTQGKVAQTILPPGGQTTLTLSTRLLDFEMTNSVRAGLFGHVGTQPVEIRYVLIRESSYPLSFSDKSDYFDIGTLDFGGAAKTFPDTSDGITVSRGDLPMDWDNITVQTDDPDLSAVLTPAGPQTWNLKLSYQPRDDIGLVNPHLVFTLYKQGRPLAYQQTKGVNVDVVGPLYATPSSILIGAVQPDTVTTVLVTINRIAAQGGAGAGPLKIMRITCSDSKAVSASWTMQNGNPVVTICYRAINAAGKQDSGQISVVVQGDKKYTLRLSYMAMIMPPQVGATAENN